MRSRFGYNPYLIYNDPPAQTFYKQAETSEATVLIKTRGRQDV